MQSLDEHQAALAKAIRSVCEQEQSATHRENGRARDRCHFRTREDQIGANAVVRREVDCGDFKSPLALVLDSRAKKRRSSQSSDQRVAFTAATLRRFATGLWGLPPRVENVRT